MPTQWDGGGASPDLLRALRSLHQTVGSFLTCAGATIGESDGPLAPYTRLPTRSAARAQLAEPLPDGAELWLLSVRIQRAEAISARYGRLVYGQVLADYAEELVMRLPGDSRFFEWSSETLNALAPPSPAGDALLREAARELQQNSMRNFSSDHRTILLRLGADVRLSLLRADGGPLFEQVDAASFSP